MEWIKTSDKMPEVDEAGLIMFLVPFWDGDKYILRLGQYRPRVHEATPYFVEGDAGLGLAHYPSTVSHWMPVSLPPQDERRGHYLGLLEKLTPIRGRAGTVVAAGVTRDDGTIDEFDKRVLEDKAKYAGLVEAEGE